MSVIGRRLHIGGRIRKDGWEICNIVPGETVDHVGDAIDLSRFADNTFVELYASHVLEHFSYLGGVASALVEWKRVLVPGGRLYVSVPNMETVFGIWAGADSLSFEDRFTLMRVIYGGQMDEHDYHRTGFFPELLAKFLKMAGFENVTEVDGFEMFRDGSTVRCNGINISLNMHADKPFGGTARI